MCLRRRKTNELWSTVLGTLVYSRLSRIRERKEEESHHSMNIDSFDLEKDSTIIFADCSTFGVLKRKCGLGSKVQRCRRVDFIPISHNSAAPKEW